MVHWPEYIQRKGSELMSNNQSFSGDLSSLWKLQNLPPIHHLTWDWWWWLVMLDYERRAYKKVTGKAIDGFMVN